MTVGDLGDQQSGDVPLEAQAAALVAEEIRRLRALDYDALRRQLGDAVHSEFRSESGEALVRATQVFWDGNEAAGDLRVLVDVFRPRRGLVRSLASDDFIRARDGSFVGE